MKLKSLIVLLFLAEGINICHSENKTFVATKEWQEIKKDQPIPPGLHVRINLQTGLKEAKLLEDDTKNDTKALSSLPETSNDNNVDNDESPSSQRLKITKTLEEALKNLPKEQLKLDYSPEKLEQLRQKYRSAEEIRKDFDEIKDNFKTDSDLMSELMASYANATDTQEIARILDDFEYYVHQYDNALWFISAGGLEKVILPMIINQTDVKLRIKSIRVLGVVTQNHRPAKMEVFQRNFGAHLVHILMNSANSDELSTAMFAFGSLLRGFPYGQKETLSKVGTKALVTVLTKDIDLKVKTSVMILISDLMREREFGITESNPLRQEYESITLEEWLDETDFCANADGVISKVKSELLDQTHLAENLVEAITTTLPVCRPRWSRSPLMRHTLLTLRNRYRQSEDEYQIEIAEAIAKLVDDLYPAGRGEKDEL